MASDEQGWVVAPDEARIDIAIGRDAKLSPELREALDRVARAMEQQQDVQGYMNCPQVTYEESCASYVTCRGVTG